VPPVWKTVDSWRECLETSGTPQNTVLLLRLFQSALELNPSRSEEEDRFEEHGKTSPLKSESKSMEFPLEEHAFPLPCFRYPRLKSMTFLSPQSGIPKRRDPKTSPLFQEFPIEGHRFLVLVALGIEFEEHKFPVLFNRLGAEFLV
jgi:hypothetical protein